MTKRESRLLWLDELQNSGLARHWHSSVDISTRAFDVLARGQEGGGIQPCFFGGSDRYCLLDTQIKNYLNKYFSLFSKHLTTMDDCRGQIF